MIWVAARCCAALAGYRNNGLCQSVAGRVATKLHHLFVGVNRTSQDYCRSSMSYSLLANRDGLLGTGESFPMLAARNLCELLSKAIFQGYASPVSNTAPINCGLLL